MSRLDAKKKERAATVARVLSVVTWTSCAVIAVAVFTADFVGGDTPDTVVTASVNIFFPLVLLWVAAVAAANRARRGRALGLLAGIALWAMGSATINNSGGLTEASFPSVSEAFFLPAYAALAAYTLTDVPRRAAGERQRWGARGTVWLETGVMLGGVLSFAGLLVASPIPLGFEGAGPLFLVAAYPVILDLALAGLVLAQIGLGLRPVSVAGFAPLVGFLMLGLADFGTLLSFGAGTYNASAIFTVPYGVAFACLAAGAAARRPATLAPADRAESGVLQLVSGSLAVVAIILSPAGSGQWWVTVPAALTIGAAGVRLVLALREARAAAEAKRISMTDELTGLPNRGAVLAQIDDAIGHDSDLGLLLLDIDGFKEVNDSLGHAAGDAVLQHIASNLQSTVGSKAQVARLGGDDFTVLVPESDAPRLLDLAHTAREELVEPVRVQGIDVSLRSSVGVAVRSEEDERPTDLLRRAEVALFEAKSSRAGALLYDKARDGFGPERLLLVHQLREGIANGELRLWFQPQVDSQTRRVIGAEALIRWHHPERGVLAPFHFLGDARRSGLMAALTDSVMHQAVRQARRWARENLGLRVSFNCAPPELLGTTLLPRLYEAIDRAELPPDTILVEVTEDSFVGDPELARETLMIMREHHVQAAIDDYGTGFSSLSYLRELPVQELKIDRSFVRTMNSDERSRVIVESTCRMAHAMGLSLVAEGVEEERDADDLASLGVDILQGYFAAKPMPADDVGAWVRQWDADKASSARPGDVVVS